MHFFYSFLRKSIDLYNVENTKEANKFFMLNAIALSEEILKGKPDLLFYDKINLVWRKIFNLKNQKKDNLKYDMVLNMAISSNQNLIFEALGYLSKFQKSPIDSELRDRKMTWDTYAVEVD